MARWKWLVAAVLFILIAAGESAVVRNGFTSKYQGGNDFYSRWAGARALLVEGRDPYSLEVTAEIQVAKGIDPALVGKGSFAFPLHVIFLFGPLAYLSYDWALAIWMVVLQWVAVAIVAVMLVERRWRPSPLALGGAILLGLLFYPTTRSILLGQFTLHVTLFLALTLLALARGRDGWAGAFLAVTSVKPQMMVLIVPWLLWWAIGRRRWRFIGALLATGLIFLIASLFVFPRWPLSFVEDVQRYRGVAGGRNPLLVLVELLGLPGQVHYGLAGALLLMMGVAWRRGWQEEGWAFEQATYWTIVISTLVPFQTGTTNQALLLIPFFAWLHSGLRLGGRWPVAAAGSLVLIGPWWLFLSTIQGNYENPMMFLPLPLLALAVLLVLEWRQWRANRP